MVVSVFDRDYKGQRGAVIYIKSVGTITGTNDILMAEEERQTLEKEAY
jgi:hypothetical protein